jgi:hypothetical protein
MVRTPGLAEVGGETGVTDPAHPPLDMAPIVAVGGILRAMWLLRKWIWPPLALAITGTRVHH